MKLGEPSAGVRRALLAIAIVLAFLGLAGRFLGIERTVALPMGQVVPEVGRAFLVGRLDVPLHVPTDTNDRARASRLTLLENGVALGPAHSMHDDIRGAGGGRFSHWHWGLLFSTSDNSDPRANGRAYSIAYPALLPPIVAWILLAVALLLVLLAERVGIVRDVAGVASRMRSALGGLRSATRMRRAGAAAVLLALLVVLSLWLGFERSGWILITQPSDHATVSNSLLGYSMFRDGVIVHKENLSAFHQVAFFAGADAWPDLYFRRPVYSFLAALCAPLLGATASLVLVNLLAWGAAVWLCWRFTLRFYADEEAARWAALLAAGGIGFVLHGLDLSAHLLSFTFYMAGVVLIHESGCWERSVEARTHVLVGAFLVLACLQYNTGVALVAAYFVVSIRRNRPWLVIAASVAALLAQPLWGHIIGAIYEARHGTPLPNLSDTEAAYLSRALQAWKSILQQPLPQATSAFGGYLVSFATFEMPVAITLAGAKFLVDLKSPAGRARMTFAVPFVGLPLGAAMVFAPSAGARGYLIYGIAIFVFAAAGAALAQLVRLRPRRFVPVACLVVAMSLAWNCAHFANVPGPAKAYFLGWQYGGHQFARWEAASLTGGEPTPRIYGGGASLAEAGLSRQLPAVPSPEARDYRYALAAALLMAALLAIVLLLATGMAWRIAVAAGLLALLVPALGEPPWVGTRTFTSGDRLLQVGAEPLVYEVTVSESVRRRLLDAVSAGRDVTFFSAFYSDKAGPEVRWGGQRIALTPRVGAFVQTEWVIDRAALSRALEGSEGRRLTVSFPVAGAWVGGWQRVDLADRRLGARSSTSPPPALPSVELRVLRDSAKSGLEFVAF